MAKKLERNEELAKKIETMSALGAKVEDICSVVDIKRDSLYRYYKKELVDGRTNANLAIANTVYQQAKKGNLTAAIFWLKTRAGWRETERKEIEAAVQNKVVYSWLGEEEHAKEENGNK